MKRRVSRVVLRYAATLCSGRTHVNPRLLLMQEQLTGCRQLLLEAPPIVCLRLSHYLNPATGPALRSTRSLKLSDNRVSSASSNADLLTGCLRIKSAIIVVG